MLLAACAIAAGFLAGSIPFGVIFARARGIDLRAVGSGNIGATNAARALGKGLGFAVFLCDAAKGFAPVWAARLWVEPRVFDGDWIGCAVGVAAFLGHLFPPWLRFRGGKGVATGFGVFLALAPWAALIAGGLFAITYAATRISSLGSLVATTGFLPALWLLHASRPTLAAGAAMWALIVFKHRGNIQRLLKRQEKKL